MTAHPGHENLPLSFVGYLTMLDTVSYADEGCLE